MTSVNSAYFLKLQGDGIQLTELIKLDHRSLSERWTTNNENVVRSGETYVPFPGMSQGGVENTSDLSIAVADFVFANSNGFYQDQLIGGGFDAAVVSVERVFIDTPDLGGMEIFRGTVGDISYSRNRIEGQVRNQWASARQVWPYYQYKDTCTWRFGSTGCGVDVTSYTVSFSSSHIGSGNYLSIYVVSGTLTQSYPNDHFTFGKLTFDAGPNSGEVRTIRAMSGDTIDLSHRLPYQANTGGFSIHPGCRKRRVADCTSKYNVQSNFLGFPWIPIDEDFAADI